MTDAIDIAEADPAEPALRGLLAAHREHCFSDMPPESCHTLDLDGLRGDDVTFWAARAGDAVVGMAALQELSPQHGEVKSMHVVAARRGAGLAKALLHVVLQEARRRGYAAVSLETGGSPNFRPAVAFYRREGFVVCPPFGSYTEDPNSVFMRLELAASRIG